MRLPGLCPGLDLCNFLLLLSIERQFTLFPGVRVPQPPATAGPARRAPGQGQALGLTAFPAPRGRRGLRGPGQPAGLARASAMRSTLEAAGAAP
jgi:hypothetical protein